MAERPDRCHASASVRCTCSNLFTSNSRLLRSWRRRRHLTGATRRLRELRTQRQPGPLRFSSCIFPACRVFVGFRPFTQSKKIAALLCQFRGCSHAAVQRCSVPVVPSRLRRRSHPSRRRARSSTICNQLLPNRPQPSQRIACRCYCASVQRLRHGIRSSRDSRLYELHVSTSRPTHASAIRASHVFACGLFSSLRSPLCRLCSIASSHRNPTTLPALLLNVMPHRQPPLTRCSAAGPT